MKKIALILSVLMVLTFTFASCGEESGGISGNSGGTSDPSDASGTRTLTALDGSTLTIPTEITKVVSLSPSATIIITGLEQSAKLVGIDSTSASLSTAPSVSSVDVSGVAALSPEIVFADADIDVSAIEAAGIPVVKIPAAESIASIKDVIRIVGRVFNISDASDSMITSLTNAINVSQLATANTKKYSVYLDLGDLNTTGGGTYLNEMITAAGGTNVFADQSGMITVTDEDIIAADPAFIFTTGSADDLTSREGWDAISAVADGYVFELSDAEVVYPSQNISATVQFIFQTISDAKGE